MKTSFICLAIAILLVCPNLSAQNAGPPLLKKNLGGGAPFPFGYQTGNVENVPMKVAPPARAVRSVTSGVARRVPQQYATIQAAINASSIGDTVLVSEGTYKENIRYYGKAIIVASLYPTDGDTSHISKTIIDGSGSTNPDSGSVVYFVDGEDTTSVLCGFTIQGGAGTRTNVNVGGDSWWVRTGGGVLCNGASARLTRNIISRNRFEAVLARGGGIAAFGTATTVPYIILEGNMVSGNYIKDDTTASNYWGNGGGALLCGVDLRVLGNVFEGDTATGKVGAAAGGLWVGYLSNSVRLPVGNIINNVFRSNVVFSSQQGAVGAGLVVKSSGNITIEGNLFDGNTATCYSSSSSSWAGSGALCVDDQQFPAQGRKMIINNKFINNTADCAAENEGAGIWLYKTTATVSGNYFAGNVLKRMNDYGGGGISIAYSCFRLQNNIFAHNTSACYAGAVLIYQPPYVGSEQAIFNNTVACNSAAAAGGAMAIASTANVVCLNNICWSDSAVLGSSEMHTYNATPVVEYCDIRGGYTGTGNINADPLFVSSDTLFHLTSGSPCIGRGCDSMQIGLTWYHAPTTDFAGLARPMPLRTHPDLGAQEEQTIAGSVLSGVARRVPQQYATIQAAIDAADSGDAVLVAEGTYKENIRYHGKAITVASLYLTDADTSHISRTIIDGSGSTQPDSGSTVSFVNGEDTTSVLCGLTITGGTGTRHYFTSSRVTGWIRAGGGIYSDASGAKLIGNIVTKNRIDAAVAWGGGIGTFGTTSSLKYLIMETNQIRENYAQSNADPGMWGIGGGAIVWEMSTRICGNLVQGDTLIDNCGAGGGGIAVYSFDVMTPQPTAMITGNIFRSNYVWAGTQGVDAGGLHIFTIGAATAQANLIESNSIVAAGASGWAVGGGMVVEDLNIATYDRKFVLYNTFVGNTATCNNDYQGGGLLCVQTTVTVSGNQFVSNSARGSSSQMYGGGGIDFNQSSFRLENNIFRSNTSKGYGGGVLITQVPISATEQSIVNNTFVGNHADVSGGGLAVGYGSNLVLINDILWSDSTSAPNEIFVGSSTSATVAYSDVQGGWGGTGNINADPAFVSGDTQFHLTSSSPCIGCGCDSIQIGTTWYHAPTTDFTGLARPMPLGTHPDMGAQEEQTTVTGVVEKPGSPRFFALHQNYPNPFNPSTTIRFDVPQRSRVRLTIYNMLGQRVAELANGEMSAGSFERIWNADAASGMYFYRIEAVSVTDPGKRFVDVKKMLLLK